MLDLDVFFDAYRPEYPELENAHLVPSAPSPDPAYRVVDARTPLPVYADHEEMRGRLRAFTSAEYLAAALDRAGHDPGDEDRA